MKSERIAKAKHLSLKELERMFPDEETARKWLESWHWPDGPRCPVCGSDNVQCGVSHPSQTHRCRSCKNRRQFSVKTSIVMQGANLPCLTWVRIIHIVALTGTGVATTRLARLLGITQLSAWLLKKRLLKSPEVRKQLLQISKAAFGSSSDMELEHACKRNSA